VRSHNLTPDITTTAQNFLTGHLEPRNRTVRCANEGLIRVALVLVISADCARGIDAERTRLGRPPGVELRDRAVGAAHKSVYDIVFVAVVAVDRACIVDAKRLGFHG